MRTKKKKNVSRDKMKTTGTNKLTDQLHKKVKK